MLAPTQRTRQIVTWLRRAAATVATVGVVAAIVYAFMPAAALVDLATVTKGALEVTVREEGKTRIRERYVVSSPLAGRVLRINLDPGDKVTATETVLATIEPADPSLLDARSLAQAQAKVQGAEAGTHRATAELKQSEAALEQADRHFKRVRSLRETGAATAEEVEDAELRLRSSTEQLAAAKFNVSIASFELEQARAALLRFGAPDQTTTPASAEEEWRLQIRSPIDGEVLRVLQESTAVVSPGAPLVEVGDPTDLEIEVDVLSEDAVKVHPGDEVRIEQWGGGEVLSGIVRLVEPRAFTKISALGVEEQRVNIIIDFTTPKEERTTLGDGFRVEADIIIWSGTDVVQVPVSCLFRRDEDWCVFVVEEGRARLQKVQIGERNNLSAQVIEGLTPGQSVVVHPGDQIADGVQIRPRL